MYVCVCNAIRDSELRRAARQADGGVEEIFAALGAEPQCGCCLEDAELMLQEERSSTAARVSSRLDSILILIRKP